MFVAIVLVTLSGDCWCSADAVCRWFATCIRPAFACISYGEIFSFPFLKSVDKAVFMYSTLQNCCLTGVL